MGVAKHYKQWIIDAGFVNAEEKIYKVCLSVYSELNIFRRAVI